MNFIQRLASNYHHPSIFEWLEALGNAQADRGDKQVIALMSTEPLDNFKKALDGCRHNEQLLNPDAVAVKWWQCTLCGRTRKEELKQLPTVPRPESIWSK